MDIDLDLGIALDNWGVDSSNKSNILQAVQSTKERLREGCDAARDFKFCNNLGTFFHHLGDDIARKEWLGKAVSGYQ